MKKFRPKNPQEFRKIGLPLRWIKSGVFRETLRIINCDLVVKFPLAIGRSRYTGEGKRHTITEISRWERLRKFRFMHPYLPMIHYHDRESGALVMSYHPKFENPLYQIDAMGRLIQMLIRRTTRVRTTDLHADNIHRRAKNHNVVMIDLGY